jgi:hypothetical protein
VVVVLFLPSSAVRLAITVVVVIFALIFSTTGEYGGGDFCPLHQHDWRGWS